MIGLVLAGIVGGVALAWALHREARRVLVIWVGPTTRWVWVTPVDINAPTVAELSAGIDLSCFIEGGPA